METGKVKWFNSQKGYGFITQQSGKEIFVHFKDIQGGANALRDNDDVEFEVEEGKKDFKLLGLKNYKDFNC